jgi:hypothetical protein
MTLPVSSFVTTWTPFSPDNFGGLKIKPDYSCSVALRWFKSKSDIFQIPSDFFRNRFWLQISKRPSQAKNYKFWQF